MSAKRAVLAAFVIAVSVSLTPARAAVSATKLPDGSTLEMSLPADWKSDIDSTDPGLTVRLSPSGSGDFLVLITVLPNGARSQLTSDDAVRAFVQAQGERSLPKAMQDHLEPYDIAGEHGTAHLYHLTDRNPEKGPGDYREADQGAMLLGDHVLTITIFTHTSDTTTVPLAKQVIASIKITAQQR